MNNKVSFMSNGYRISGMLSLPKEHSIGVIFIHGGGKANLERYRYLQNLFNRKGIASLIFDFMGCGRSEGKFEDGSLNQRIKDAHDAINYFLKRTNLDISDIYLWGSSMGAHIACRLLENLQVKGVVLQSAAAYGKEAEIKKFNEEFTKSIKKPNNWESSPAFKALTVFKGRILVVYGNKDTLIPEDVKDNYHRLAVKNSGKFVLLKNGVHTLLKPSNNKEQGALYKLGEIGSEFIHEIDS